LGTHRLDIQFWREGEETKFAILRGDPKLVERRSATLQSELLNLPPAGRRKEARPHSST